jgi:hypothetical protein
MHDSYGGSRKVPDETRALAWELAVLSICLSRELQRTTKRISSISQRLAALAGQRDAPGVPPFPGDRQGHGS